VSCVKCGSFRLRLKSQFDEEAGKLVIVLTCPRCREQEIFQSISASLPKAQKMARRFRRTIVLVT
jgi:hypothetical protein